MGSIRKNLNNENRSSNPFCTGSPVKHQRDFASNAWQASNIFVLREWIVCASSKTIRSHSTCCKPVTTFTVVKSSSSSSSLFSALSTPTVYSCFNVSYVVNTISCDLIKSTFLFLCAPTYNNTLIHFLSQ